MRRVRRLLVRDEDLGGWEYILDIVGKGDNMPIAGLIPIIAFFTYLSLDEAFRHDRLIKQGREDEILDEMYK